MLASLLFPPVCLACRRLLRSPAPELPLCSLCRPDYVPLAAAQRRIAGILALHAYAGPLAQAVAALKYSGQVELAGPLGRLLAAGELLHEPWDAVVPVPMHWSRAVQRGFNQALLLARWALRSLARPPPLRPKLLQRCRRTPAQAGLSAATRQQNLACAFSANAAVADIRILLVDDVTTTGATFAACRACLLAAGAREVAGLALLRTLA